MKAGVYRRKVELREERMNPKYRDQATLRPQARRRGRRVGRVERLWRNWNKPIFTSGSWKALLVVFIVVGLSALFRGLRGERDE